jgi:hypothetical protein
MAADAIYAPAIERDFALIRDRQEQLGFKAARMQIGKLELATACAPGRMSLRDRFKANHGEGRAIRP